MLQHSIQMIIDKKNIVSIPATPDKRELIYVSYISQLVLLPYNVKKP